FSPARAGAALVNLFTSVRHYRRTGRRIATHLGDRTVSVDGHAPRASLIHLPRDRGARRLDPGRSGVVVGPRPRVRRRRDLVRLSVRLPPGARLSVVRGGRGGARGAPTPRARPAGPLP